MADLPVMLRVAGRRCVVIGGGSVAARRVASLIEAGAAVTVIAPQIAPDVERVPGVTLVRRRFQADDLHEALIVVVATDDAKVNEEVAAEARRCGVLVNRADDPPAGDIAMPAHARHGPITIAVHTSGISASAAAVIRRELSAALNPQWPRLLELVAPYRAIIQERIADPVARREALARLTGPEAHDILRRKGDDGLLRFCENIAPAQPSAPRD